MNHWRKYLTVIPILMSCSVYAGGGCSYGEAIMALERGNTVRGMALMRMAARDGDSRAHQFLAQKKEKESSVVSLAVRQAAERTENP